DRPARAGSHQALCRHRAVPYHGDGLLVAPSGGGADTGGGLVMDFYAVLEQIRALLQGRGRVTYRALQVQFQLDDAHLEALKAELIDAEHVATDEQGKVLV